jgi:hypothetical protein
MIFSSFFVAQIWFSPHENLCILYLKIYGLYFVFENLLIYYCQFCLNWNIYLKIMSLYCLLCMVYGNNWLHQVLRVIDKIIEGNISEKNNCREYIATKKIYCKLIKIYEPNRLVWFDFIFEKNQKPIQSIVHSFGH